MQQNTVINLLKKINWAKVLKFTWVVAALACRVAIALLQIPFKILVALCSRYLPTEYRQLPSLDNYLTLNPTCRTARGIKCCHCNSGSIRNFGLETRDDEHRVFICNHCNAKLYRTPLPDDVKNTAV